MTPEGSLLDRYDTSGDGKISRDEVLVAVEDYIFRNTITRDDVLELIELYIFG